jgi:hypothetical protein
MQWGNLANATANAATVVNFPITFPSSILTGYATYFSAENNLQSPCATNNRFTSNMEVINGDSSTRSIAWFVIGH